MAFKISVASGKGGTGKTTVSLNLYHLIAREHPQAVMLVDCDVEEPNAALFFPQAIKGSSVPVNQEIPVIDTEKCTFCRKCVEYCEFNAILVIPPAGYAEINPVLCHSCGACRVACKNAAIWIREEPVGHLTHYQTETGRGITDGTLNIGSPMQTMVIRALKKSLPPSMDILLFDAPPGTSCPVVETLSGSDYVILVTEPTPFGLHDLKLMMVLVKALKIPVGVVINKAKLGNREVYDYLQEENTEILCEIPFDPVYASQYSRGQLFNEVPAQIAGAYKELTRKLLEKACT